MSALGIASVAGLSLLSLAGWWLARWLRRRAEVRRAERYARRIAPYQRQASTWEPDKWGWPR